MTPTPVSTTVLRARSVLVLLALLAPAPSALEASERPYADLLADVAQVHVELRSSSPGRDAVLAAPPDAVSLHLTGEVDPALSRIEVTGPDGRGVMVGAVEHPGPDERDRLRVALSPVLEPGRYRVDWRIVSPDGHVVQGSFDFWVERPGEAAPGPAEPPEGVRAPPPSPSPEAAATPTGTIPPGTGTRWLQLLGTILFLGVVGSYYGMLPLVTRHDDLHELGLGLRRGVWRAGWFAVVLLLVSLPARLYVQFWGDGARWTGQEVGSFLFGTGWGAGWFLHLGVVALGGLGLVLAGSRGEHGRGWAILGVTALLLPLVPALQGHAWAAGGLRPFAVSAQYLHVLGVGLWLGGLLLLLFLGLPAVRAEKKRRAGEVESNVEGIGDASPPLARVVNAFSRMALPAVVIFLVSGSALSWIHTGGELQIYLGTTWGRTLLLKLALVAGILALGFYNWRRVRPALAEHPDPGALRIPASVEVVLGLLVLLITAVLVATPLP
jgi:putative copper export protein/methionine-rich copper-binding protein CopC